MGICRGMKVSVNPSTSEAFIFHLQGVFASTSAVQSFADFDEFSGYQKHAQISDVQQATVLMIKFWKYRITWSKVKIKNANYLS